MDDTSWPLMDVSLTVNGRTHRLTIEPRETLLEVLRDRLGLTGAKRSCDVEVCGTCTVLLGGKAVSACTLLAYEAHEREVLTIEGLGNADALDPLQQSFLDHGAVQCGFCTSGFILCARALTSDHPTPSDADIRAYLRGNICRCTGYRSILDAIRHVVAAREGRGT
jgi:carbon-monoxide dehydrogenase small subunit